MVEAEARPERTAAEMAAFKRDLTELIPQVRAFARFLCMGDRAAADDLSQEALTKAWQARLSYQPGTQLRAWLFTIVRNVHISEKRRAWRSVAWDDDLAERRLHQQSTQNQPLELDEVRRAMKMLPDEQREALVLVTAGGLSYEEAAEICGCAVGTIKSRTNRARTALAHIMETGRPPAADEPAADALDAIVDDAQRIAEKA
ncbi:MAG: sigma-70 family RNA polymerase sigma factor [Hyphomonadaceae bacterium]